MDKNTKWRIWSIEHNAWWKPKWNGYTKEKSDAGIYEYEEALQIVREANEFTADTPKEAMILVDW